MAPFGGYDSSPKGYGSAALQAIGRRAIRVRRTANSRRPWPGSTIGRRASIAAAPRRVSGRLSQHPDQHRPQRPVLLAVDQELGERPRLGVPVELADAVGPLEVGKHQDAEKLGARSGAEGVETLPKSSFELLEVRGVDATARFPVDR